MPRPLLMAVFLLAAVALVAGPGSWSFEGCAQTCPDDEPDGGCLPQCADCACCPARMPMLAQAGLLSPLTPPPARAIERVKLAPPAPEPQDIFHVPKRFLA